MKGITRYLSHPVARLRAIPLKYWIIAVVAFVAVWFFFLRSEAKNQETLTLAPKDFLATVSVAGSVTAAQEVDLGFTQSGRITAVYARVGQHVAAGATLAVIDNGDLRATLLQRQATLENQEARLASLKAGTRPEELAVAQSAVNSDELELINDLQDAYRAADAAVHNTLDQFMSNPRSTPTLTFSVSDSSLKNSVESKRLSAETMLSAWGSSINSLTAQSLSTAVPTAQNNLSSVAVLLSETNAALNRAIANAQTTQATIDSYIASVGVARTNVNAAIAALSASVAALDASRKALELKRAGSTAQDIAAQAAQVKAAQADVAAAQAQLSKTVISAPFSGIVATVDAKVGKIVSPNTPEISLISSGAFQIETYIPEVSIAQVQVGDKANVTLDAYGDAAFEASVVSIDPAETLKDGVSTYRAVLQFSAADPRIKSGMTASVSITTEEKPNVLQVPLGAIVKKEGKDFVQVQRGKEVVEVEITKGSTSLGNVEVFSGLSAGDIILLNPRQ